MTSPVWKLTKGTRTLDLTSGRYRVSTDAVPPPIATAPQFAEGTSANRAGASLATTTPRNRQWVFGMHVYGSSDAEITRGIADLSAFLALAGDESEPLYIEFKPNSDTPEPLWGNYGANYKYEIVYGAAAIGNQYGIAPLRAKAIPNCIVSLIVKPFANGKFQRAGSAMGGIVEDVIGATDKQSRGLLFALAATNYFTNPVNGSATWNTNWSAGTSLTTSQNTDERFVLFGLNSAKIVSRGSSNNNWTQSLTLAAATYALSCYAKRPDSAAVSSADMQLFYNNSGPLTTTFTSVGDGWYRCTASFTGVASAQATGAIVAIGRCVYLTGFDVEDGPNVTPFFYGDMIGCSWSGSAHASTSARTAARVRLPIGDDTISLGQGSVRVVWRAYFPNTFGSNMFLWSCASTGLRAYYQASDDKFYLTDGTNTISTAAQTFSAGDIITLHFTWGPSGLVIYKNGASAASGGTYSPPSAPGSYLYIGTDDSSAQQGYGPFMDLATWDVALTSTQASDDYTNIAQLIADGQSVGTIPWFWTKDGDDVIDDHDDADQDNWGVSGGIPGSDPADTDYRVAISAGGEYLFLGHHTDDYLDWLTNTSRFYIEGSGTALGSMSGGAAQQISAPTGVPRPSASLTVQKPYKLSGPFHFFARFDNTAGTDSLTVGFWLSYNSGNILGTDKTISISGEQAWYLGAVNFEWNNAILNTEKTLAININFGSAATETFYFDFCQVINGNVCLILPTYSNIPGSGGSVTTMNYFRLRGLNVFTDSGTYNVSASAALDLVPGKANTLIAFIYSGTNLHNLSRTYTFTYIKVSPRYALL